MSERVQTTIRLDSGDKRWVDRTAAAANVSANDVITALIGQAREQNWTVERQPAARVSADEHL